MTHNWPFLSDRFVFAFFVSRERSGAGGNRSAGGSERGENKTHRKCGENAGTTREKSENGNKTQKTQFENGRFAAFDGRFAFDLIFAEKKKKKPFDRCY